jgi:hypothetical protein
MPGSKKPIKITLFHANWCGHCTDFMPTWDVMKEDKTARKNIDFEQYEESSVGSLPDATREIDGVDVRSFGWPTLKITVNDVDHLYKGRRTSNDIYEFILDQLKGANGAKHNGLKRPVGVEMDDSSVRISTSSDDVSKMLTDMDEEDITKGGSNSKKIFKKIVKSTDFKSLNNDSQYSEMMRKLNIKK